MIKRNKNMFHKARVDYILDYYYETLNLIKIISHIKKHYKVNIRLKQKEMKCFVQILSL